MSEAITLPSGLRVVFRPWASNELVRLFEAARAAKDGHLTPYYRFLGVVWEETLDSGPYDSEVFPVGTSKPGDAWKRLLFGDVIAAITFVRRISLGDEFAFPVRCTSCGYSKGSRVVLLSELPMKALSSSAAATVREKKQFSATVAGKKITFDLMTPAQDEIIDKLLEDLRKKKLETRTQASMIERFAVQVRSIEGEKPDLLSRWRWVAGLEGGGIYDLRDVLAEQDCGIEQAVPCECGKCGFEFEATVPLVASLPFWMRPETPRPRTSSSSDTSETGSIAGSTGA